MLLVVVNILSVVVEIININKFTLTIVATI